MDDYESDRLSVWIVIAEKQLSTNVVHLYPAEHISQLGPWTMYSWTMYLSDCLSVWIVIAVKQRTTTFVPLFPAIRIG